MDTPQTYFWSIFWASVFGLILLLGLVLETMAEKESYKTIRSFRGWKLAKRWGGRLVMLGVLGEVVVGSFAAVREHQNDPANQPITSIRANAVLLAEGTNFWHPVGDDPAKNGHFVTLSIGRRDENGIMKVYLNCTRSERYWGDNSDWFLEFGPQIGAPLWNLKDTDTVKSAEQWDVFVLDASFLKGGLPNWSMY